VIGLHPALPELRFELGVTQADGCWRLLDAWPTPGSARTEFELGVV